jgi:DNA-binding CsgD family transcriptional regulator
LAINGVASPSADTLAICLRRTHFYPLASAWIYSSMPDQSLNSAASSVAGEAAQFKGVELLTPREREVLALIVTGASNKEAGRRLDISPRTVESHRARIMEKLGARNAADLVGIVLGHRLHH